MHTMNDNELEKRFRDEAASFSLSAEEKARMRRVVSAYAAMKPVRRRVAARSTGSRWYAFILSPRMAVGALVVVLVASSAGVSYAAESALPGDILYAVKVKVNEPVAQALSTTPQAKAQTAVKLAHRRLDEAATLAAQGRLGTSTREKLQEGFETHVAEAVKASAQVSVEAALPATTTLAQLDKQLSEDEDKLGRLSASTTELAPVIASVKEQRIRVAQSREGKDDDHSSIAAAMATSTDEEEGDEEEDKKKDMPAIAAAKRKDARFVRENREEIRRRATATLVASTTATTTATSTATTTEDADVSTTTESFIDATIRAGENAGFLISESVRAYFKRWSEEGKEPGDQKHGESKKGIRVQLKGSSDNSGNDRGDTQED